MSRRLEGALFGVLLAVTQAPDAAAQMPVTAAALSKDAHVRPADREAGRLLQRAAACSPVVSRAIDILQTSDLIVVVETAPLPRKIRGQLRVTAAAGGVRYVRVTLATPNAETALLATLGHEFQHALEVSGAPAVRDVASQRTFYLRVGYEWMGGGRFETDAAQEAGRLVAKDVARCAIR